MEKLKQWTERYMHIRGMYDGGRDYKWADAYRDLVALRMMIRTGKRKMSVTRGAWIHHLAEMLYFEVTAEAERVHELIKKENR